MPKGDRLKLKADPEDGTTPIANLLLEAVAMAKLSGLQVRAILYLWRRTYGWVEEGKRVKERKIALTEWVDALDSEKSRVSKILTELESKCIIKRRMANTWGGYYYSITTNIRLWNSNSINIKRLSELTTIGVDTTVGENATVDGNDNSGLKSNATVVQNATQQLSKTQLPTLYKESLKKDKERKDDKNILSSPVGEKAKEVFGRIDKIRGYRPPKRKAEAASILRMLKTYSPDQIIESWQSLKKDKFWQDKELFMMSVESQIGAKMSKVEKPSKHGDGW